MYLTLVLLSILVLFTKQKYGKFFKFQYIRDRKKLGMMNRSLRICYFICIVLLLTSCSTTKFVPDGEYLLDKVEIVSDNRDYKSADLKSYLRQQPNFKIGRASCRERV